MGKMNLPQNKIVILIVSVLLVFILFFYFVYLPARNSIRHVKIRLSDVENQILQIESMIGTRETIEESKRELREIYGQLKGRFSQDEKESLKMISDSARKSNIEIISIKPQPKTFFLDSDNQKIIIEGKTCQKITLSMEMRSSYKDLVGYIKILKESLPAFLSVERLKINKDNAPAPKLFIVFDFNLYILS